MHNLYIAEIFKHRATFLLPIVWINLHSILHSKSRKKLYRLRWCITVIHGHWRSSKLVPIESQYATSYWFFHCNYMPIFYRFWEIGKNLCFCCFYPPQSRLKPSQGGCLGSKVWNLVSKTGVSQLPEGENCMILRVFIFIGYRLVMNRQTDNQWNTAPPIPMSCHPPMPKPICSIAKRDKI